MTADPYRYWMFAVAARVGMTVSELGRRMPAAEFREWVAFILLENGKAIEKLTPAVRDAMAPGRPGL